jgi:RND family efflux transporter MFP subunit
MKRYIGIIISMMIFAACSNSKADENNSVKKDSSPAGYTLATVEKAGVASVIKLPAQLAAYQEVSIFPKVNGYVKTVFADIGSRVSKGNLLMVLEAPEIEQATIQAKERYARTKADFSIDKEHYQRLQEASNAAGAISPLDLSTIKAKMDSDSALCNAEKSNWQMQETMQTYLKVTAPFDGVITERNVHPGALVSAENKGNKPMLELKEIDHLRLQVDIPEGIAATMRNNDTITFYLSAFPGKKMTGRISRKSMNINMQYRSERVELDVYNKEVGLAPGMYADVLFNSKGNPNGLSVPKSAVVTSTERKYVLAVRNGKAVKVDVSTGNQNGDKIEIIGALLVGEEVITNANDEIKEGMIIH